MANDVNNVAAGKPLSTGGILIGPLGTPVPADESEPLTGMTPVGYIGEDGLSRTIDRVTEKIRAWGGDTVKITQTEHSVTYTFNMIEILNPEVAKAYYGEDNVTVTDATASAGTKMAVTVTGEPLPAKAYDFEIKDGDAKIRHFLPHGAVSEQGETVYADAEVIAYPMTVEALPDDLGVKVYEFSDNGVKAAA